MFAIIKKRAKAGEQVFADGVLEILPDGFGFLRSPDTSYTASTDDIYISPSQVRRFNLHTGDMIEGEVRTPKDGERYFALTKLDSVNGGSPEQNKHKVLFEDRKSTRLNSSHLVISYAVFCLKKKKKQPHELSVPLRICTISDCQRWISRCVTLADISHHSGSVLSAPSVYVSMASSTTLQYGCL